MVDCWWLAVLLLVGGWLIAGWLAGRLLVVG
jgi:hypothetical protein